MSTSRNYTVVGGGAIGGTLAVHLAAAGHEVRIVDADVGHVQAINARGLTIETPQGNLNQKIAASIPDEGPAVLGAVLLAVKSQATEAAMDWIAPRLAADGYVASMQNGLNEPAIAARIGADRTVEAFVDLFADVTGPGVVKDGGAGTIALGDYGGAGAAPARGDEASERVRALAEDLWHWGEPIVTGNVRGFLWAKLAFGAMLTATALQDEDMSVLVDRHRDVMTRLAREVFAVAVTEGVQLEPFDAFEPELYAEGADPAAHEASVSRLVEWLDGQAKKRSGIWRDLAVRRRPTEIPHQYGTVLDLAAERGIQTPVLARLVRLIQSLERGEAQMGPHLLDELAA
ncbi:ketopantoate reductase family protein [Sediminivirga luteola]|uniref:ketopantoate reductase family protein n=1 Tax=Sediminivirga luteola TaxID=1774748 RepID=UPI001F56783C|nr:2-dehydropantoate 2-reductase [Sediminivirga luteola]MCI2265925.1 2-dehydropantoate 2-reductase [Sediminivirga luteola]